MDEEPLYQQVLAKLQELEQGEPSPESTSSEKRPWRSRSRSPVPLQRPLKSWSKAKALAKAGAKKMPKAAAMAPQSQGSDTARSPVPGPISSKDLLEAVQSQVTNTARSPVPGPSSPKEQSEVPRPSSAASNSSSVEVICLDDLGPARSQVPGPSSLEKHSDVPRPSSAASNSSSDEVILLDDLTDEESEENADTHEWVQRDCWVCCDCGSMNLRFTQFCTCGTQREREESWKWEPREDDWICKFCRNRNFKWRKFCIWSDCPTADWTCECGNINWGRRRWCNRRDCQKPRPW